MLHRLEVLEGKIESLTQAVQGLVTGNTPVTLHSNNTHHAAKAKALSAEELARAAQSLHKQGVELCSDS
jgi:hypothetical protein